MRVVLLPLMALQAVAFLRSSSSVAVSTRTWLRSITELMKAPPGPLLPLQFELKNGPVLTLGKKGDGFGVVGDSKIAVATLLLQDPTAPWGSAGMFPEWAVKVMSTTQQHVKNHGHSYILRKQITMPAPDHMKHLDPSKAFRINANWEKFQFILDYLNTGKYSNILLMDADATFFNPKHDTLVTMSQEMENKNVSLLMADEDWWGKSGPQNTNGGVQMWRNTTYAKELLKYLIAAHMDPTKSRWACWGNEQMCLRGFLTDDKGTKPFPIDQGKNNHHLKNVFLASGLRYNRHICALAKASGGTGGPCKGHRFADMSTDPEIIHFMGGGHPEVHNPIYTKMIQG